MALCPSVASFFNRLSGTWIENFLFLSNEGENQLRQGKKNVIGKE